MTQTTIDKELFIHLVHDVQALDSVMHSKLVRINEEIRVINKQPYIHKQVDCLSRLKESRKVIDKSISKINELLVQCIHNKTNLEIKTLEENTVSYKLLKEEYFK